jgi:acetyl esterase/lipase
VKLIFAFLPLFISCILNAQQKVIPLYNGAAPGSENWNWEEKEFLAGPPMNAKVAYNVVKPTLTVFIPDSANGTAIIICPGGALRVLNIEHEGTKVARELNKKGITVFMLKYRLVRTTTEDPFQEALNSLKDTSKLKRDNNALISKMANDDAMIAITYVRKHAAEFSIDPSRVGAIGFSGGGSLAIRLSSSEKKEIRPDFAGIIYARYNSIDYPAVPEDAPPVFIACASDDTLAVPSNSLNLYKAWIDKKRSAELHIFTKGSHGLRGSQASRNWILRFTEWLDTQGLLKTKQ